MGFLSDLFGGTRPEYTSMSLFDMFPDMQGQFEALAGQTPEGGLAAGFTSLSDMWQQSMGQAMDILSTGVDGLGGFGQLQEALQGVSGTFQQQYGDLVSQYQQNFDLGNQLMQSAIDTYQTTGIDASQQLLQQQTQEAQELASLQLGGMGLSNTTTATNRLSSIGQQGALQQAALQEQFAGNLAGMQQQQAAFQQAGAQFLSGLQQQGANVQMNLGLGQAGALSDYTQQALSLFNQYQQPIMQAQQAAFEAPTQLMTGMYNLAYRNPFTYESSKTGGIGTQLAGQALGMVMSDIRLKTNLVPIGSHHGLTVYKWDWTASAKRFGYEGESRGFIAQEVELLYPEAVLEVDGFKQILYKTLTKKFDEKDALPDIELMPEEEMFMGENATEVTYGQ